MGREDTDPPRSVHEPGELEALDSGAGRRPSGRFPDDWPPGCPPDDAPPASGKVYRIVRTSPPTAADFRSHREMGKLPDADPCLRRGLSMFQTVEGAMHARELFRRRLGKFIACGTLASEHGKLKPTPSRTLPNHVTWWAYVDVARAVPFSIVEEDQALGEETV